MKRSLLSLLLALLCVVWLAPAALAEEEWCPIDPNLVVRTPGGNTVVVHVTNYAFGSQHVPALRAASIEYAVQSVPGLAATDVDVTVLVPDDAYASGFPTRTVASTQPFEGGIILARDDGKSGQPMRLRFRLDVP
ncbi:MAG TPA: hypothetical protein VFX49_15965 [Chloroflexota bacterium]|nr:hypothetical protein [Chloroflexota bacterium]